MATAWVRPTVTTAVKFSKFVKSPFQELFKKFLKLEMNSKVFKLVPYF